MLVWISNILALELHHSILLEFGTPPYPAGQEQPAGNIGSEKATDHGVPRNAGQKLSSKTFTDCKHS